MDGKEDAGLEKAASVCQSTRGEPRKPGSTAATHEARSWPVPPALEKYPKDPWRGRDAQWPENRWLVTNLAPAGQGSAWSQGAGPEQRRWNQEIPF